MIEFKLTAENAPDLFKQLREILEREPLQVIDGGKPDDEPPEPKAPRTRKKRASKKAEGRDTSNEPVQHLPEPVEDLPPPPPTIDEVRSALHALSGAKDNTAVFELLKQFGASKISELKEADYPAIVKAALESHS